jgi:hypothetical protein
MTDGVTFLNNETKLTTLLDEKCIMASYTYTEHNGWVYSKKRNGIYKYCDMEYPSIDKIERNIIEENNKNNLPYKYVHVHVKSIYIENL